MADKRISQLNSHTSPSGSDLLVIVNNNETKKITYANLTAALTGSQTNITALNQFTQSFNSFSASVHTEILAGTNEQDLSNLVTNVTLGVLSGSVDGRLDRLEANTGSYLTSLNGAISSSSQLTSSYDTRYVLSGSITQTTWDNISGKPDGLVSQSTNLTSLNLFTQSIDNRVDNLENVTSSYETKGSGILSGSVSYTSLTNIPSGIVSQSVNLSSLNAFTSSYFTDSASIDSRVLTEKGRIDAILSASTANADTFAEIVTLINSVDTTNDNAFASYYTSSNARISSLENTTSSYETKGSGIVSGSSQLTSSLDLRYATSASYLTSLNGAFSSSIQTLGGSGVYSSSAQLPNGLISGSSQLTASYDTRYALSGSGGSTTIPVGTVSGSSQLTSSYDGRYTLTSSFNAFTASAQAVTTGSNSFNGTQTITGSLIITTGSFVGSQILANTSSLYLTSGSNMYVQNNGVVEITGSLNVNGTTTFVTTGGDEGGEINFGIAQTNTTLQNRVTNDIWRDRFRIFEGSANAKGVFIDLSKAPDGASGEITWKASGIVNAGTFVQLDNIKATVPTSGNRALALATASGTISGYISAHYQGVLGGSAGVAQTISLSTSTSTSVFGWNFGQQGDTSHYILRDDTNNRVYRFILIIGGAYNNNFISIERLH